MNKSLTILILSFLLCTSVWTQNLNGIWKGTLTMTGGCFDVNYIELQLTISGEQVTGYSYHYRDIDNYIKKKCSGRYDPVSKKLIFQEEIVTTYKIPFHCSICIKKYELIYSNNDKNETLIGGWTGYILDKGTDCMAGSITLSRIKESAFKSVPEVIVDTGTIQLDFYDNGEVDGDSISVKVNNKVVLSHQKLTSKPVTTHLRVDLSNPFQEIEMIAENLGSIPPNTALLIVTAGTKRYRLFLTSTESKSAVVRFVYENPNPTVAKE